MPLQLLDHWVVSSFWLVRMRLQDDGCADALPLALWAPVRIEFHVGSFQELHAFPEAVTAHGPSSHGQGFEFCTSACPGAGSEASHLVGVRFDLTGGLGT